MPEGVSWEVNEQSIRATSLWECTEYFSHDPAVPIESETEL